MNILNNTGFKYCYQNQFGYCIECIILIVRDLQINDYKTLIEEEGSQPGSMFKYS